MSNDFVSGDTGSSLVVICTDKLTNLPISLAASTVLLKWKKADNTLATNEMTVLSATEGKVKYQFLASELFAPAMSFEVEITDASGKVISNLSLIDVKVREQLA